MSRGVYEPKAAWRRAATYFAACLLIAGASGTLTAVLEAPLATTAQFVDPAWWTLTATYLCVVAFAYGVIWPLGTFTDNRKSHPLLSLSYGAVWGCCQGLLFLSIWTLLARSGLAMPWLAVASYLAIGSYNGLLHRYWWDIRVSPPHNYTEWNGRKVLLCHTPNLLLGVCLLGVYGNGGIFVLLQGLALALSAHAMRFPAYGDDYRAEAGRERSLTG